MSQVWQYFTVQLLAEKDKRGFMNMTCIRAICGECTEAKSDIIEAESFMELGLQCFLHMAKYHGPKK